MAYDPNMQSIAKSMRSIALAIWVALWISIVLSFLSFAWAAVTMAAIGSKF